MKSGEGYRKVTFIVAHEKVPEVESVADSSGVYKISMVRMSEIMTDEVANVRVYTADRLEMA